MASEMRQIAADPYHPGTKALTGYPDRRAARVGGWRIIYTVRRGESVVEVDEIAPRGEAYRGL